MKYINRFTSILLTVVLLFSIMVLPASAATNADVYWAERISRFRTLNENTKNSLPGYTKVLQMFMVEYSTIFSDDIYMHGGIDGYFGNAVKRCVVEFQDVEDIVEFDSNGNPLDPGTCSKNTWYEIGLQLWDESYETNDGGGYIIFGDICRSTLTSPYVFEYAFLNNGNPDWEEFHSTTY